MQQFCPQEPTTAGAAARLLFPDSSRRTLQQWLRAGRFFIDGRPVLQEKTPLVPGQVFSAAPSVHLPRSKRLDILYEDRHCVVMNKPSGLLSVPLDEGGKRGKHALGLLREHYQTDQIFAVHRIDRETSGVLLFARGKWAEEQFDRLFERHDIERVYLAIVEGRIRSDSGTWRAFLEEREDFSVAPSPTGKEAITHFRVLRRSAKYSFLELTLETGRKHQIRVHCREAGHPVIGDKRYGAILDPIGRLGLHATRLSFLHPFTGKRLSFSAPAPRPFAKLGC